jgi:uncharacterized membrane protein YbaN (DUF454 family)
VTRDQAKEILLRFRPGSGDAEESDVAAALEFARQDLELSAWLKDHSAFQKSVQIKLRGVRPPADLKASSLAAREGRNRIIWLRSPALWAAAAAIALLLSLGVWWVQPREDRTFSGFRERMVRTVLRDYRMDLLTSDLGQIRRYLTANQAHGDYVLTKALQQVPGYGCAVLSWQNHRIAMVCFEPNQGQEVYLFVADRADVPDAPASGSPRFQRVNRLNTAVWTNGSKVYLLAAEGNESLLVKYAPASE